MNLYIIIIMDYHSYNEKYMRLVCSNACENIEVGGGPFACIITDASGSIISTGENMVRIRCDPTQHAEMVAIQNACKRLKTHDLSMCSLYTSCEPCPMCFSAIYWARITQVYYGNSREDAAAIGFDDAAIYVDIARPISERKGVKMRRCCAEFAKEAFDLWKHTPSKKMY
jgi:tRNA(Arg) A34 adenosine deaminase TadA